MGARPAAGGGHRRRRELAGGQVSRGLAVLLTAAAGIFVGLQAPVNSRLGKEIGSLQAATVSFTIGLLALIVITSLSSGGISGVAHAGRAPWWALIGGVL